LPEVAVILPVLFGSAAVVAAEFFFTFLPRLLPSFFGRYRCCRTAFPVSSAYLHKILVALIRLHRWMDEALRKQWVMADQDQRISEAIDREGNRLRNFIRRRVADRDDAEDVLQDVFYELVEAYRLMKPVEQVTAWLFRVARNRITDLFRKKTREALRNEAAVSEDGETLQLDDLLPSPDAGPDAAYARSGLLEELDAALDELPDEQREVFVAHELMGYSFKELAEQTGVSVNTLLSRKHYAVVYLRGRLRSIRDEFTKT
jgi:RNA polymerase sigma factor (sigma-70 family)